MEVSRSGYYHYLKKARTQPIDKDFELLSILPIFIKKTEEPMDLVGCQKPLTGYAVGRFRTRSLMKKAGGGQATQAIQKNHGQPS